MKLNVKLPAQRWWVALDLLILTLLLGIAAVWYGFNHAYGAWGDDAPGYIYAASELYTGQALVKQDSLVQDALAWFTAEPWARFVAPAHHEIIAPSGWTVSKYPLGLSLLMAITAWLVGSSYGFYLVVPLLALVVIACTYIGAVWLFPLTPPLKRVTGIGAAILVMCTDLFGNYAMAQPMREIPSMAFFMGAFLVWIAAVRAKNTWLRNSLYCLTGLLFAYTVGIRETSAVLLPVFIAFWWPKRKALAWKPLVVFVGAGLIIGYSFFIYQAVDTSLHKEKFRNKDVTSLAITANFDHIQSLSPSNLFNNQGKFKPGVGGLEQYWEVANQFNAWPLFMLTVVVGLIALWKKQRTLAWAVTLWIGSIVLLFGMWINPYARYILPILPALAWCSLFGILIGAEWLAKILRLSPRWGMIFTIVGIISLAATQIPAIEARQLAMASPLPYDRAISHTDAATMEELAANITTDAASTSKPALLLMLGTLKGGLAETIMAHTNLQVIRYPSKPNEQPPYDQLLSYISHLQERYTLYIWYDASVSAIEQRLYNDLARTPISVYNLSMQPDISIERINN